MCSKAEAWQTSAVCFGLWQVMQCMQVLRVIVHQRLPTASADVTDTCRVKPGMQKPTMHANNCNDTENQFLRNKSRLTMCVDKLWETVVQSTSALIAQYLLW
jgi:hypothetical protein